MAGPPHLFGQVAHGDRAAGRLGVNRCDVSSRALAGMHALDGVFLATRRDVFAQLKFDEEIAGFHCYDLDFTYRAFRAGLCVGVACDLELLHFGAAEYGSPAWHVAAAVFERKHRPTLPPPPAQPPFWVPMVIPVNRREEALDVMRRPFEA